MLKGALIPKIVALLKREKSNKGKAGQVMENAKKEGLLLGKGGRWGNVVRIAPPMLLSESDLADGCDQLDRALAAIR